MKLAHLILCHKYPDQVKRMVEALRHPDVDVYIHVDKKAAIEPFLSMGDTSNVTFVRDRVKVYWGGYSIVKATLAGFKEIRESGRRYDYINLMSGQDYPLRAPSELLGMLASGSGALYMNIFPEWDKMAEHEHRLKQYYFSSVRIRGKYTAERIARFVNPRVFPEGFVPIGRSQWFAIPIECIDYILTFMEANESIVKLFRYMWAPDELLFQSILYNSPFRGRITDTNSRYVDWSDGNPSPRILTMEDARSLTGSGDFFARKFDILRDGEILDYLDKFISSRSQ